MIIDKLANASLYHGLGKRIAAGLKFLTARDLLNMEPGKYEIDGSNVYAMVMDYETKPPEKGFWEAHRRYLDIQYVARGVEQMGWANVDDLCVAESYDEAKDFVKLEGSGDFFAASAGTFVIFWPHDAHMPSLAADAPASVRKVVVKVLAE